MTPTQRPKTTLDIGPPKQKQSYTKYTALVGRATPWVYNVIVKGLQL